MLELPDLIQCLLLEKKGTTLPREDESLCIRTTHAPLARRWYSAIHNKNNKGVSGGEHASYRLKFDKVVWYLPGDNMHSSGDGDDDNVDTLCQILSQVCYVKHLDLMTSSSQQEQQLQIRTNPIKKLRSRSTRRLVDISGLESIALHGTSFGDASSATLEGICDGLATMKKASTTSLLRSIVWAPCVTSPTTFEQQDNNPTSGLTKLVRALCRSQWPGSLLILSSFTTQSWQDVQQLIQTSHLQQLELYVTGLLSSLPPPPTFAEEPFRENMHLQSLVMGGTAVLECWEAMPDDLVQILWRNRWYAAVVQLPPLASESVVAWLATNLIQKSGRDTRVYATPLYTLLRNHYIRPSMVPPAIS
mmetsp:Transcript_22073/g.41847  ORF Transcript_22073/g.41847 Transcript_22073/m.41847 type:complete len:361 (+) Transcript_22073:274-1356(+)